LIVVAPVLVTAEAPTAAKLSAEPRNGTANAGEGPHSSGSHSDRRGALTRWQTTHRHCDGSNGSAHAAVPSNFLKNRAIGN
jgi:hypothetical protein